MSFILDALRKAERDRNLGQAPRMEDVALAPETAPGTTPAPAKRPSPTAHREAETAKAHRG